LLMDLDEMSILYRRPSIDASYQVSLHLAERFHHRQFLFLIGRFLKIFFSETACPNDPKLGRKHLWKVLYKEYSFRSNSINKNGRHRRFLFLIGLFLKIFSSETTWLWRPCLLTDWDKISNLYKRTFHRCFLPSFGSFGHAVSEEKNFRKLGQIDRNLVGSIYGRSSMGISHSVLIC
jgi:hypothetical protein